MTEQEIDDFMLDLVQRGARQIDSTARPSVRGKYGVSPQYLATMLRDRLGPDYRGWPSIDVQTSLSRLRSSGKLVDAEWSPMGAGYLGIGQTRPTIPHRPRALQLGAAD